MVLIDFLQEAFELNKPPRSKKCNASSISQLETGKDAVMSMSVGAVKHGERHQSLAIYTYYYYFLSYKFCSECIHTGYFKKLDIIFQSHNFKFAQYA